MVRLMAMHTQKIITTLKINSLLTISLTFGALLCFAQIKISFGMCWRNIATAGFDAPPSHFAHVPKTLGGVVASEIRVAPITEPSRLSLAIEETFEVFGVIKHLREGWKCLCSSSCGGAGGPVVVVWCRH